MPNFREMKLCILHAYRRRFINNREFVLLYNAHTTKNPDFPYWNYDRSELDLLTDDECKAQFRFYRDDIYKLADELQLPDQFVTYNGLVVGAIPALCI